MIVTIRRELEVVLGDRVEPCSTREAAVTLVDLGELAIADVEKKMRVEEFAVPAKQPDEQLHRPDVEQQAKVSRPS